ncbi:MAG: glycoside-pentoside-hexuronide (GPH):cation symporter [Acholeplasmatales bacterium]|jgi:melibiose permease/lactose/raffinose/galactose permease|nr:glycoside-pentoside-hexuronide (GPH):cation symporter [Acholeplasmatales bacterium]
MTQDSKNRYFYSVGTIGRDMFYSLVFGNFLYFITIICGLNTNSIRYIIGITVVFTILRVFDALNDPLTGYFVDKTKSRYGKFKPWILIGTIGSIFAGLLLFVDWNNTYPDTTIGTILFIGTIFVIYLILDFFFGLNDTAYWGMLPSLSSNNKQREKTGSVARICASIGSFSMAIMIMPLLQKGDIKNDPGILIQFFNGNGQLAWIVFMVFICILMLGFQLFTLFGVKEKKEFKENEKYTLKDMWKAIASNDQLIVIAISMLLFNTGYMIAIGAAPYFCRFVIGQESFYSTFALVLGVSQLITIGIFPFLTKILKRNTLFTIGFAAFVIGFIIMAFSYTFIPLFIVGGIFGFAGQGLVQVLMLIFIQDTVEYGQLKNNKRSVAVTFSTQSFINKGSSAIGEILFVSALLTFINFGPQIKPEEVVDSQKLYFSMGMFIIPIILAVIGYIIYKLTFKIDEKRHDEIVEELKKRGDVIED